MANNSLVALLAALILELTSVAHIGAPSFVHSIARAEPPSAAAVREIEIVVEDGYKPNRIELHEGERVRLKFVRKEYNGCTRELLFPKLNIKRELPPNQPVVIELPALRAGEYEFKCGMNMIKGTLVVKAHAHG